MKDQKLTVLIVYARFGDGHYQAAKNEVLRDDASYRTSKRSDNVMLGRRVVHDIH